MAIPYQREQGEHSRLYQVTLAIPYYQGEHSRHYQVTLAIPYQGEHSRLYQVATSG